MTEACAQAADRMLAFQQQLNKSGVAPATVSELISSGVAFGQKRPIWTKALTAATIIFPNALLFSTGMLAANAFSAASQTILRSSRETIKGVGKGVKGDLTDLEAHWRATLGTLAGGGQDAKVYRNAARYFWSTFMEGRASDIHFSVDSIAKDFGISKAEVMTQAKELLWKRFLDQNPNIKTDSDFNSIKKSFFASFKGEDSIEIDRAAQELFSTAYDYAPKHAIFHDPGATGKVNSIAKAIDFALTTPSRLAIGVDETAKVFFRHQLISEQIYADAIKANKKDPSKSVARYHQEYTQELYGEYMNAYNSVPKGGFKNRYHNISKGLRVLEGKFDSMFLDRGISFNDIREQALQMTFQRQTSGFKKDTEGNYILDESGAFVRTPSIIDKMARMKGKTGPQFSATDQVLAVAASATMPFVKTPFNILIEGASYTPLATFFLATKQIRQWAKMQGYDTSDLLARQVMGYTTIAALTAWMMEDDGTGMPKISGIPVSYQERERWKLAGIPEQSIRIGDTWVPYGRIEPIAMLLSGLANARYHLVQGNEEEYMDALLGTAWKLTAEKQSIAGVIDFLDNWAYGKPEEGFDRALNNYIKSYIPTGAADVARAGDVDRLALTSAERIQQRIPGMREDLPVDYASIAEADRQVKGWEVFLKMQFPEASWTDLQKEIYKTGVDINKPDKILQGVELNSKELSLLRKVSQDAVTHGLSWLITTDSYKQLLPSEKAYELRQATNRIRSAVFVRYIREASKPENFGAKYATDFAARKRNVEVKRRGREERLGLLTEPEYAPET